MENNLENWPVSEGRYEIGNKRSPVAVCTNATVEGIKLDMEKVAIIGKCVTENIGIEKIIQNVVSNPHIRFLILCGKASKGHFVGQAIISLIKNGIDKDKRIIGAKGNTPFLKRTNESLIERFRKQIIPIDLMGEENSQKIMAAVRDCWRKNPGHFTGKPVKIEKIQEIQASSSPEWIADPRGFFVVSIDRDRNKIITEHYQNNKLAKRIVGDSAEEISKTIARLNLIGDFKQTKEHAMYLGRELQKAEIALKSGLDYEQDSELKIEKSKKGDERSAFNREGQIADEDGWFD